MPTYEIINPSDKYTIVCPDHEVASVACFLLGEGRYGFDPIDGSHLPSVPIFLFGGAEEWVNEQFGETVATLMDRCLTQRMEALADAFDSTIIGNREAFFALAPAFGEPGYLEARAKWHEANRSSLNDIGGRAYRFADHFRKRLAAA
jgi:hypothetical protein